MNNKKLPPAGITREHEGNFLTGDNQGLCSGSNYLPPDSSEELRTSVLKTALRESE
jgi:hypothetical protein